MFRGEERISTVRPSLAWLLMLPGLAACQTARPQTPDMPRASVVVEEAEPWRGVASARDAAAVEGVGARWTQALAASRGAGFVKRVSAEGVLLEPAAGLPRAAPAPGSYRCRSIRLGARRWTASAQGFCYVGVEDGQLSLATELKGLRLGGYLWELKGGARLVFLGAAVAAGSKSAAAYGDDPARDTAGLFERIGEFRYRLALPDGPPGAGLTVVELVAAPRA